MREHTGPVGGAFMTLGGIGAGILATVASTSDKAAGDWHKTWFLLLISLCAFTALAGLYVICAGAISLLPPRSWTQSDRHRQETQPENVGKAIADYEDEKAVRAAGVRQAVVDQLKKPPPRPRGVSEVDWLTSHATGATPKQPAPPDPVDVQEAVAGVVTDIEADEIAASAAKQAEAEVSAKQFAQKESAELLGLADALVEEMWDLRLKSKQHSTSGLFFDTLPAEFLERARAFNGRVFKLAVDHLSKKEASDVAMYPALTPMMGAKQLEPMFESNRETLGLIQRRVTR